MARIVDEAQLQRTAKLIKNKPLLEYLADRSNPLPENVTAEQLLRDLAPMLLIQSEAKISHGLEQW